MAEVDYAALKKGGFMRQAQKDTFSMRLKVVGGQLTVRQLETISRIAGKYGKGYIHLTSRQGVEIPFIALKDIDAAKQELAEGGVAVGVCGPRVRTVTACQGSAVCPSAAIETTALAGELDERYFGLELPHKFKIGITGCANNCLKAEENDLGIKGGVSPSWDRQSCVFCGVCELSCPTKAIAVDKEQKELSYDAAGCVYCGRCVKSCPSDAWKGRNGYLLSFGGMFGNTIKKGLRLLPLLFDKEQVFTAADRAIAFFRENAAGGERMGKTLARLGPEALQKALEQPA
jgi:dissimilatory sulfite reductase (desulfoviridin) alpha/beta subunit